MSLLKITNYFTVNVVLYIVMLLSNILSFFVIESVGRRLILVYGIVSLTAVELASYFPDIHIKASPPKLVPVNGYHGLCVQPSCNLGDTRLYFSLVRIIDTATQPCILRLMANGRAIIYQLTIGAIGLAVAAEIPSLVVRPATISLVGLTQGGV